MLRISSRRLRAASAAMALSRFTWRSSEVATSIFEKMLAATTMTVITTRISISVVPDAPRVTADLDRWPGRARRGDEGTDRTI